MRSIWKRWKNDKKSMLTFLCVGHQRIRDLFFDLVRGSELLPFSTLVSGFPFPSKQDSQKALTESVSISGIWGPCTGHCRVAIILRKLVVADMYA